MFSDLKKGFQVHTLDTNTVPKYELGHESKSNKTPLYLIGELIGVPNTVMDSALHELKDRIDKDPKYKDVKNWLESLPKI